MRGADRGAQGKVAWRGFVFGVCRRTALWLLACSYGCAYIRTLPLTHQRMHAGVPTGGGLQGLIGTASEARGDGMGPPPSMGVFLRV